MLCQIEKGCRNHLIVGLIRWPARQSLVLLALAGLSLASSDALAQSLPAPRTIEGKARIVDGDTLEIGIDLVDLHGVDAPEPDQRCERGGKPWRCGMEATYAMAALIETHWLICRQRGTGTVENLFAVCRIGGPKGISVNQEIVRRGWALASPSSGSDYAAAEQDARAARVGMWSGTFVTPWEWRRTKETGNTTN